MHPFLLATGIARTSQPLSSLATIAAIYSALDGNHLVNAYRNLLTRCCRLNAAVNVFLVHRDELLAVSHSTAPAFSRALNAKEAHELSE